MKSFEIVNALVKVQNEKIRKNYQINAKAYDILRQYCDYIDVSAEDFEAVGIDAEINDDFSISIAMLCPMVSTDSKRHPFVQLLSRALTIQFRFVNDSCVKIIMRFPTLWDARK